MIDDEATEGNTASNLGAPPQFIHADHAVTMELKTLSHCCYQSKHVYNMHRKAEMKSSGPSVDLDSFSFGVVLYPHSLHRLSNLK